MIRYTFESKCSLKGLLFKKVKREASLSSIINTSVWFFSLFHTIIVAYIFSERFTFFQLKIGFGEKLSENWFRPLWLEPAQRFFLVNFDYFSGHFFAQLD